MHPQVRYAKSADGTRLAVSTLGQGRPFVIVPNVLTRSLESYLEVAESRENMERLAQRRKVVLYDFRGVGLSSQDVEDFSLPALESDLEAVADLLESPDMDILAIPLSGPVGISFAAHHLERVRKLVLWGSAARGRDVARQEEIRDIRGLIDSNWKLFVENLALISYGWTDDGRRWAESLAAGLTRETYLRAMREFNRTDVTELLTKLRCQTLVLHRRGFDPSSDMEMAATIPNARMVTLGHDTTWGFLGRGRWESTLAPMVSFLDEDDDKPKGDEPVSSGTAVILFADIVDSTALTERLGDDAFREKAHKFDAAMRAAIRDNSGTAVEGKTLGDGVLAVFTSAKQAIACAQACHGAASAAGLALHAGIHAGDVIREDDNVYGGAVNIAARVAAAAAAGETLVSATVRELARTSAGVAFEDRGEQALKGIDEPVRVWAVREV